MATGIISWSQTAATNAMADSNVNWAEGQAPSTVNDSARGMMASAAKWRDDISGIIVTGGSGTAYTATSNQVISANTNGMTVQFSPGTTNTGAVTLSVDGQTAKPIRFLTGVDLPSGVLVSGSLYQVTYRLASDEWLLHSFNASIYAIPIGGSIDYWGSTAPNSAFVLPTGQAISRTTYSTLFALIGTVYGAGDGSTTFNLPDLTGRVVVMKEAVATRLTTAGGGVDGGTYGATGGTESVTLTLAQLPTGITSPGTFSLSITNVVTAPVGFNTYSANAGAQVWSATSAGNFIGNTGVTASGTATSNNTSGASHKNVQPTIVGNKIMRII